MQSECYHCEKTSVWGRSHTHRRGVAGGRWKKRAPKTRRLFKANLQKATILENGRKKQVKLCGKCIKRVKFDINKGNKPFLTLINLLPTDNKQSEVKVREVKSQNSKGKITSKK